MDELRGEGFAEDATGTPKEEGLTMEGTEQAYRELAKGFYILDRETRDVRLDGKGKPIRLRTRQAATSAITLTGAVENHAILEVPVDAFAWPVSA